MPDPPEPEAKNTLPLKKCSVAEDGNSTKELKRTAIGGEVPHSKIGSRSPEIPEQFGRYEIVRRLGKGGMGVVYLARDPNLDRDVAIKIPRLDEDDRDELLRRFLREAKSAAALQHPNICPIFDVGEIDGIHYMTMAYIQGKPLSSFIRPDSPQEIRKIVWLIRELALALQEAHENGIVHRDLKPDNVMINERGTPIIMDFGLARRTGIDETTLTMAGTVIGTPAYLAPEQIVQSNDKIGTSSDVYSLCVVMYEMITGRVPFEADSLLDVLPQIARDKPRPPSELRDDVDPELERILLSHMEKDPEKRPGGAGLLAKQLFELRL